MTVLFWDHSTHVPEIRVLRAASQLTKVLVTVTLMETVTVAKTVAETVPHK